MYRCCGSDRRNIFRVVSVTDSLSRLTRDYLSTFFLVYIFKCVLTLCIWVMIIISVFVFCTCITVTDFISCALEFIHVDRRDFRYWRGCLAKLLVHMSFTTRSCQCNLSDVIFCIEMARDSSGARLCFNAARAHLSKGTPFSATRALVPRYFLPSVP